MSYYVCATFDAYDPVTGFFVMKMDCIEWNEDDLGPWGGPKYNTKQECYAQSVCSQEANNPTTPSSNNYCGISINSISLVDRTTDSLTFTINIPETYLATYIQYAFYDIDNNQLSDFKTLCGTPDPLLTTDTFTINDNFNGVCAIAFRLLRPCETESGSGGQRSYIPIEDSGGAGAAASHWEKSFRKPDYPTPDGFFYPDINDIMTHKWGLGITDISVSFLADIGYNATPGHVFSRCSWADVTSSLPYDIREILEEAASEWESYISYYDDVFNAILNMKTNGGDGSSGSEGSGSESGSGCTGEWDGLYLNAIIEYYADPTVPGGQYSAFCSLSESISLGGLKRNAVSYALGINTYWADRLSRSEWTYVMKHELGHALGIGTLWTMNPEFWLYKEDYPLAFEAYNKTIKSDFENNNNCPQTNTDPANLPFNGMVAGLIAKDIVESNTNDHNYCGCSHMLHNHKIKSIGNFIRE